MERRSTGSGGTANALIAGSIAILAANIALTAPTVITGKIQLSLHATGADLSWYSALYGTAAALSSIFFASLGDRWGRKRVLLSGFALLLIGSIVSGTAPSPHLLWVGQTIAGFGGGALYTLSLTIIVSATTTTAESRARGIAVWAVLLGVGTSLGTLISGGIVQDGSWRLSYVALGAIALIGGLIVVAVAPESKASVRRSFDAVGQILIALTLLAVCYASIEGSSAEWTDGKVIGGYVIGAVLLAAFIAQQATSKREEPLMRLSLFRSSAFSSGAVMAVLGFASFLGLIYLVSLWLAVADRLSPWQVAYWMMPNSIIVILLYPVIRRLLPTVSSRWLLGIGTLPLAAAELWLAYLPVKLSFGDLIGPIILVGIGFAFLVNSITAAMVNSVPYSDSSMAAGIADLLSLLGRDLGIAVFGSIAFSAALSNFTAQIPALHLAPQAAGMVNGVAAGGGVMAVASAPLPVPNTVPTAASAALVHGFHVGLVVSAIVLIVAAVACLLFLRDNPSRLIVEGEDADLAAVGSAGPTAAIDNG
ncbi:MAG TPA: MFS transporter [Trebonia sp.]